MNFIVRLTLWKIVCGAIFLKPFARTSPQQGNLLFSQPEQHSQLKTTLSAGTLLMSSTNCLHMPLARKSYNISTATQGSL